MTEPKEELRSKVKDWLKKSGYPLEMYAYKKLLEFGFYCEKSPLYTDVESGDEREIDIVAEQSFGASSDSHDFAIHLLVECKKTKQPLVVLSSGPEKSSVRVEVISARTISQEFNNATILAEAAIDLKLISSDPCLPFSQVVRSGYSIVQALKESDEVVHKALFGLAKAEHYYESQHEELFLACITNDVKRHMPVAFPISVLVVDAPIFDAYLDGEELKIEESEWSSVTFNLPWTPRPTSDRRANIQVVRRNMLPIFLEELTKFGNWFGTSEYIRECAKKLV
jgi:hypothetical protein